MSTGVEPRRAANGDETDVFGIWVHNGPLWRLCSTCRSWRREDRL